MIGSTFTDGYFWGQVDVVKWKFDRVDVDVVTVDSGCGLVDVVMW